MNNNSLAHLPLLDLSLGGLAQVSLCPPKWLSWRNLPLSFSPVTLNDSETRHMVPRTPKKAFRMLGCKNGNVYARFHSDLAIPAY